MLQHNKRIGETREHIGKKGGEREIQSDREIEKENTNKRTEAKRVVAKI
jgi:hypothetical protein